MTTVSSTFLSTAIPFVNAEPHLGFAYELVLADILARHRRRRGRDVRFQFGTDDHSLKNVTAALRAGVPIRDFVDERTAEFHSLAPLLDIAPDDFIATSRDPRHRSAVERLWRACAARGDLYTRPYRGRYCAGCEAFLEDHVVRCDEHGTEPEVIEETNWFFRLSRYREQVRALIADGGLRILSDAARAETLAFLDGEVRDISVSRDATRAAGWGIPVPDDPTQVIYVWFDALANYISTVGFATDGALFDRYWRSDGERIHVIGKGITRFHAVYWLAFLLSADLPLPTHIAVHGYLTVDGVKISKSSNPAPVPPVVERWGADTLRWHFARRCRTRVDSDVPVDTLGDAYDRDLADRLGNLVQRTVTLAAKLAGSDHPVVPTPRNSPLGELRATAEALPARVDAALAAFLPDDAAVAIVELLDAANRYLEVVAPWQLARTDREAALASLYAPLEAARFAAGELAPFVPGVARTIADRLGGADLAPVWGTLRRGADLRIGPPPLPRHGKP
ncbi:MAG TPA: methionine--tRNA ligase [Kofleriaceae bacterium]|jgi:methionyl-tRNA synthetase